MDESGTKHQKMYQTRNILLLGICESAFAMGCKWWPAKPFAGVLPCSV